MSVLSMKIEADLVDYGYGTAAEIADRIGEKPRAVASALLWMRGEDLVNAGVIVYRHPDGEVCMHDSGMKPLVWELGPHEVVYGPCPNK